MQTEIEYLNIVVDHQLERQIKSELAKIEERFSWVTHAIIHLKKSQHHEEHCICEIELRMPGPELFVSEAAEKFRFAITKAFDKMHRQLEKRKARLYKK
ncbi:MAG: ribosome-associated translation inhibitor RaiA [Fulvivirga sp.]|nr:ribosome-associated translation inhibitor RaiA [Fulvivirga sp.]